MKVRATAVALSSLFALSPNHGVAQGFDPQKASLGFHCEAQEGEPEKLSYDFLVFFTSQEMNSQTISRVQLRNVHSGGGDYKMVDLASARFAPIQGPSNTTMYSINAEGLDPGTDTKFVLRNIHSVRPRPPGEAFKLSDISGSGSLRISSGSGEHRSNSSCSFIRENTLP